jgi:hypothetical protein
MGTHPNTLLILALTPQGLSRKTLADILAETNTDPDRDVMIGGEEYHHLVMEESYNESWQISSAEGDLLFFDYLTYGYGEARSWAAVEAQKNSLEEWAKGICERHHCTYEIRVSANYW